MPLMSNGFTLIPESLQIPNTFCSRVSSRTSIEIPDISTLLRPQAVISCSKLTIEILEQGVKYVQS